MGKDYSTSKFEDAIAEAAYMAVLEGDTDASSGSVDTDDAYDLVTLDPESLAATGADVTTTAGSKVIIRTDSQGFVWTHYGPAHPTYDPAAYRALMAEWNGITAEVNTDDEF